MGEYSLVVSRLIFHIFNILNGWRAALTPSPEDVKNFVVSTSLSVARFFGMSAARTADAYKIFEFPRQY